MASSVRREAGRTDPEFRFRSRWFAAASVRSGTSAARGDKGRLDGGGVRVVLTVIVEPASSSRPPPLAHRPSHAHAVVENLWLR
jgi:hypothetical protein